MRYARPAFLPAIVLAATTVPALAYRLASARGADDVCAERPVRDASPTCDADDASSDDAKSAEATSLPCSR